MEQDEAPTGQPKRGNGERVLVVEDNDLVRGLTVRIFEELGYHAEAVARADLALERVAREPAVELVLSDVVLPGGMSGFELGEQLQITMPELPIIFVSGYPAEAEKRSDQYEVLYKPYTTEQLAETVRQALRR